MQTVKAAVTAALAAHKDVYVAAGTYGGKPGFLGSTGNIGVYGGYDPQTWQRSAANATTLQAPGQVVGVFVPGIVLQLLTVNSTSGASALSSYGVRVVTNGSVALSRVHIQTAPGSNGADGAPSAAARADAPWGGAGILDCLKHGAQGGRGDDVLWGGDGGAAWDVDFSITGHNGMSDTQPFGGWGGQNPGQSGGQGAAGQPGVAGAGGSAILNRAATLYAAADGADGTDGARGEGGGGGAGSSEPCVVGAGGGAGGRPGSGGHGGHGGGGSIGLFVGGGAHALVLDGSSIQTSNGGKGGWGPAGQPGGAGGTGGPAASTIISGHYYQAGAGGNGGYGGQGGQGGGGAGGASVGVLAIDARAVAAPDTQISVGLGGAGGKGGFDGQPGAAQKTAEVTTAGGSVPALGDFDGDGIDDAADECPTVPASGTGCPAPSDVPAGPVAGDPTATAAGSTTSGSGAVAVSVLPASSCVAKRVFTIRINARKAHIKTARLTIDGRRLKLVKRSPRRWTAKIDLRRSTRTRHTLTIRGTLHSGKRFKQTRRYRICP